MFLNIIFHKALNANILNFYYFFKEYVLFFFSVLIISTNLKKKICPNQIPVHSACHGLFAAVSLCPEICLSYPARLPSLWGK